jgi:hypothetical protein
MHAACRRTRARARSAHAAGLAGNLACARCWETLSPCWRMSTRQGRAQHVGGGGASGAADFPHGAMMRIYFKATAPAPSHRFTWFLQQHKYAALRQRKRNSFLPHRGRKRHHRGRQDEGGQGRRHLRRRAAAHLVSPLIVLPRPLFDVLLPTCFTASSFYPFCIFCVFC